MASEEEEPVAVYVDSAYVRILFRLQGDAGANKGRVFGIDLASQLIEGNFVNYRQIVPESYTTRAVVERQTLVKALKTAQVFARTEADKVDLDVKRHHHLASTDNDGQITVSAVSAEMGDCEIELPAQVEGDATQIAFNVQFLLDALGAMDGAQVALELDGGTKPGTLRPVGDDDYLVVVMPMHVRS